MDDRRRYRRRIEVDDGRINAAATAMGVIGFFGLAFALGRAGRGGEDCCDKLVRRELEVIRLQQRVGYGDPLI